MDEAPGGQGWSGEVPLGGGAITQGVVRVGNTVRRPTGPWSPAVHALLEHLEAVGFEGAPRFLGLDDQGREILTFHPGTVVWPDAPELLDSDAALARAADLIGRFHQASSSFEPPPGSAWWPGSIDPEGGTLVLHGDLAPWNLIVGEREWTIIDWDSISPGRLEWELAYILHSFVPLWPDLGISDAQVVARVGVFSDAYGLNRRTLEASLELIPARCRKVAAMVAERAAAGDPPFVRMQAAGGGAKWLAAAEHAAARVTAWRGRYR